MFVLLAVILSACNLPKPNAATQPGENKDPIGTAAAMTVQALSTNIVNKVTTTPGAPGGITTPQIGVTPQGPSSITPTEVVPTPESTGPDCNSAEFVKDVTVDDGTEFKPSADFTKTWQLKNTGQCTWTKAYRVVFSKGDALGAPTSFNLPADVPPGGIGEISVQMKAPDGEGDYSSEWMLQDGAGNKFGLGSEGADTFWAKITVKADAANTDSTTNETFAVTSVKLSSDTPTATGTCPFKVVLRAEISTTAAGKVTYFWERSDGVKSNLLEVDFDAAGTKVITNEWPFNKSFSGTIKLYIDNPNHQYFPSGDGTPLNVALTCQ